MKELKEAVITILEILSTAVYTDSIDIDGDKSDAQCVIDPMEIDKCKVHLEALKNK